MVPIQMKLEEANLKNTFVSPYPTIIYRHGLVGQNFFISQIRYPLNLIVNSPLKALGNEIKYINNFKDNTVYIGQFPKFANCQLIKKNS